jgi:type II secretory ATPase GspE/PulE/Tfp pilus assembly ATPase PilB-like protein
MRDGLVEKDELEAILDEQRDARQHRISGHRLGEILIQRGMVTPTQIAKLVAEQYELPFVDFDVADIDLHVAAILSEDDTRRFSAVPINRAGDGTILLAIADPSTVIFSDELRKLLGSVPRFVVVGPDAIERAISHVSTLPGPSMSLAPAPTGTADDLIIVPSDEVATNPTAADAVDLAPSHQWPPLGALLLRDELVTDQDIETALAQQRLAPSLRLGEILIGKGLVTRAAIARLIAEQYELPFHDIHSLDVDPDVARLLPEEVAWRLGAVPIARHEDGSLDVAIADPTGAVYSDELHRTLAAPLTLVVASPDEIESLLERAHTPESEPAAAYVEPTPELEPTTESDPEPVLAEVTDDREPEPAESSHLVSDGDTTAPDVEQDVVELLWPHMPTIGAAPDEAAAVHEPEQPFRTAADDDQPHLGSLDALDVPGADVFELSWPSHVEEVELEGEPLATDEHAAPEADAEGPESPEGLPAPEMPAAPEAELVAFSWLMPEQEDGQDDETSLEGDLALVEPEGTASSTDHADESQGAVVYDIFGVGSEPQAEAETPWALVDTTFADGASEPLALLPGEPEEPHDEPAHDEPAHIDLETDEPHLLQPVSDDVSEIEDDVAPKAEDPVEPEAEPELEPEDVGNEIEPDYDMLVDLRGDFPLVVEDALASGASTLHFSPLAEELVLRARVDGVVRDLGTVSQDERDVIVARLESDGIARTHVVPTSRGQKTTLFVRDRSVAPTSIDDLGLDPDSAIVLREALARPTGAILVCGPTGAGTTTTLYAALDAIATSDRIVTTVEQPVEHVLDGVDQIEVDPPSGRTYASVLADLRFTDTDAVFVGDLPDREAATLALTEAYEGRLVVAGLRAPSAAAAIVRLANMGVDPSVLASSLGCVVSQRLVRTVCDACRETYYASPDELAALDQAESDSPRLLARGAGCPNCLGSGLRGRAGLFEVMPVTDELRRLVAGSASAKKMRKSAVASGMRTLRRSGVRLCLDGMTTVPEIVRVLGDER